jgi:hypothetical protein
MLKRFVVMRVPETFESVMSMTPVAGLLTLEAAESVVRRRSRRRDLLSRKWERRKSGSSLMVRSSSLT